MERKSLRNKTMSKKHPYQKPAIKVILMRNRSCILAGSDGHKDEANARTRGFSDDYDNP
jgi:hypothetical protein